MDFNTKKLIRIVAVTCAIFYNPSDSLSANESIKESILGPGKHDWGYVEVRPGAHMFWLLYFTTNSQVSSPYEKPLVIWLQGGPGMAATAYGNFLEFGPMNMDLKPRNYSWVEECNILFIDNPVGTGFSYVDSNETLAKNNIQVAGDLLNLTKSFLNLKPEFRKVQTYIFSESYGGKMAVDFALMWHQTLSSNESNLKGLALGDAYISPADAIDSWAPYLLHWECFMVGDHGFGRNSGNHLVWMKKGGISEGLIQWALYPQLQSSTLALEIKKLAHGVRKAMVNERWHDAKQLETQIYDLLTEQIEGFNVNNVLEKNGSAQESQDHTKLTDLMNGKVREVLNITDRNCIVLSDPAYDALDDFMKPVTYEVEKLLNETDLKIFAYSGELDFLVNPAGSYTWLRNLSWKHRNEWGTSGYNPIFANGAIEAFQITYDKLSFFIILRSGHVVPKDNPVAMFEILKYMINS